MTRYLYCTGIQYWYHTVLYCVYTSVTATARHVQWNLLQETLLQKSEGTLFVPFCCFIFYFTLTGQVFVPLKGQVCWSQLCPGFMGVFHCITCRLITLIILCIVLAWFCQRLYIVCHQNLTITGPSGTCIALYFIVMITVLHVLLKFLWNIQANIYADEEGETKDR